MKRPSRQYWVRRGVERLKEVERSSEPVIANINGYYSKALDDIEKEIKSVFDKYAKSGGLTKLEAEKLLSVKETAAFYDELLLDIAKIKDKDIKQKLLAKYNAPAYASRISRLQALQDKVYIRLKETAAAEKASTTAHYIDVLKDSYYKTGYDTAKGLGVGIEFAQLNDRVLTEILHQPIHGKNYSQRIWDNTDLLAAQINEIMGAGFQSGKSFRSMAMELDERMGVGMFNATRLIRTEANYFHNQGKLQAMCEIGTEKYRFTATLDLVTSTICRKLDNKIFLVIRVVVGVNYPPMHPFCRSVVIAYFSNRDYSKIQRRARDPVTGKTYLVPADMSYEEWYNTYVEGKDVLPGQKGDTDGNTIIDKVYNIDYNDRQKEIASFIDKYRDSDVEHALVIARGGRVYKLTGWKEGVNISLAGKQSLYRSTVIHNHPGKYAESFSLDDFKTYFEYGMDEMQVTSKNFTHRMTYRGNSLSANEAYTLYNNAKIKVMENAFNSGVGIESEQLSIMRVLKKELKGLKFNEKL